MDCCCQSPPCRREAGRPAPPCCLTDEREIPRPSPCLVRRSDVMQPSTINRPRTMCSQHGEAHSLTFPLPLSRSVGNLLIRASSCTWAAGWPRAIATRCSRDPAPTAVHSGPPRIPSFAMVRLNVLLLLACVLNSIDAVTISQGIISVTSGDADAVKVGDVLLLTVTEGGAATGAPRTARPRLPRAPSFRQR